MHVFMYVSELGQRNTHLQSPDASNSYRMMGFFGRGYFAMSGGENAWIHGCMDAFEMVDECIRGMEDATWQHWQPAAQVDGHRFLRRWGHEICLNDAQHTYLLSIQYQSYISSFRQRYIGGYAFMQSHCNGMNVCMKLNVRYIIQTGFLTGFKTFSWTRVMSIIFGRVEASTTLYLPSR